MKNAWVWATLILSTAMGAQSALGFPRFDIGPRNSEAAKECQSFGRAVEFVLSNHLSRRPLDAALAEKFKTEFFILLVNDIDSLKMRSFASQVFRARLEAFRRNTTIDATIDTLTGKNCAALQEAAQIPLELAQQERKNARNWSKLFEVENSTRLQRWKKQNPDLSQDQIARYIFLETLQNTEDLLRLSYHYFFGTATKALFRLLDPHSSFNPSPASASEKYTWENLFLSFGIEIAEITPNGALVSSVFPQSSAAEAGLRKGDSIQEVCGIPVLGHFISAPSEASDSCSPFTLQIFRKENPSLLLRLKLDPMPETTSDEDTSSASRITRFHLEQGNIAVIRLKNFDTGTAQSTRSELESLLRQNDIHGIVLDLRGNLGGYVLEAQKLAGMFISGAPLLIEKGRNSIEQISYTISDGPVLWSQPILILMDHNSASASELLAGGLQSLDRAFVISQDAYTYGKGTIQDVYGAGEIFPYGEARVTRAFYFFPNGKSPQRVGVSANFYLWKGTPHLSEAPSETLIPKTYPRPDPLTAREYHDFGALKCWKDLGTYLQGDFEEQILKEHRKIKPIAQKLNSEEALTITLKLALRLNQFCR